MRSRGPRATGILVRVGVSCAAGLVIAGCPSGRSLTGDGPRPTDRADESHAALDTVPDKPRADSIHACVCKNPLDTCNPVTDAFVPPDTCVRAGYTCDALNPCDNGYTCSPDGLCLCSDIEVCGLICTTKADCPSGFVCGTGGLCRQPLACLADAMCGSGQLCIGEGNTPSKPATCADPGTVPWGQPCTTPAECVSGVCETNICLPRCVRNSDCPNNLLCAARFQGSSGQLGCKAQTDCAKSLGPDLGLSCTAATAYCTLPIGSNPAQCRSTNCLTGSDCATGDCVFPFDAWSSANIVNGAYCSTSPKQCNPDELVIGGACYIAKACWVDVDCPVNYQCKPVSLEASLFLLCRR